MKELPFILLGAVLIVLLVLSIADCYYRNKNRWEDKKYARKLIQDPERHSRCITCNRPRPHKKMIIALGGFICHECVGLK